MNVTCPECRSVFRVDPSKLPASMLRARCAVCGGLITVTPSTSVRDEFAPSRGQSERATGDVPSAAGAAHGYGRGDARSSVATAAPPPAPAAPPVVPRSEPAPPRPGATETAPPNLGAATAAALLGRVDAPPGTGATGRVPGAPPRAPSPARPSMPFVRPGPGGSQPPAGAAPATPFAGRATPPAGHGAPRRPINPFLANDPNAKARRLARALISDMVTYFPEKREEGLRTGALKQLFEEEITKSYGEYVEQVGREFAETTPFFQEALNEILAGGRKLF